MSELIKTQRRNENFRRTLLANVSALALLGYLGVATGAQASADDDHPIIWVELGGQMERATGEAAVFSPPFFSKANPDDLAVLTGAQKLPPFTSGFEGKLSFTPENSDWVFSGAIRFGRSGATGHPHHQSAGFPTFHFTFLGKYYTNTPQRQRFADAISDSKESHAVLDFQAGKDVGLGLFGAHGSSVVNAGVRFAQFTAASDATIHARPVYALGPVKTNPGKYKGFHPSILFQSNTAIVHSRRSTQAIGPSLSWDASASLVGDNSDTSLNFDWGMNASILFGRQRAQVQHQTTGYYFHQTGPALNPNKNIHQYTNGPYDHPRSRTAMIPNVGGFAGFTISHGITRVKFGYRADFFFNAMDNGIDTRKSQTLGFYGPFATISVGLGG